MKLAKFGPGGNSAAFSNAGNKSSIQAPEWINKMGLDAYEYECGNGVSASDEVFACIGLNAVNCSIKTSVHAPYYISLSGIDPEKRLGSIKYIIQSLSAARCMGADIIVVHAGSASKIDREDALKLAADTLAKALAESERYDFGNVKIGVETMGKLNQLGTLDEVIDLCKIDKRLSPVVDFGHLYARSCGTDIITADHVKTVFEKIDKSLGADVAENLHCHFSCIEYTEKGERRHLTFNYGSFGPNPMTFAEAIAELGVAPTVICESAGTQDVDAKMLKSYYLEALK